MKPVFVNGVRAGGPYDQLAICIRDTFLRASDNCAWLCEWDIVSLKPALNSPDPFPSTTHPLAIRILAETLEDRGARVIIGEQPGIEHVLHHKGGVIRGSSRANYARSGMGSQDDPRFVRRRGMG